jgi:hypothetical protein
MPIFSHTVSYGRWPRQISAERVQRLGFAHLEGQCPSVLRRLPVWGLVFDPAGPSSAAPKNIGGKRTKSLAELRSAWTGPFDFAQGRLRPVPHTGYPKNESAQDPGLSLGTPVEQPSPRTAQTQIRFRAPKRKWPCRASATAPPGYAGELGDQDQAEELEIVKRDGELLRQAQCSWGSASPSFFHAEPQRTTDCILSSEEVAF